MSNLEKDKASGFARLAHAEASPPVSDSTVLMEAIVATETNGVVSISYLPLATMDDLHVLLLAAVAVQATHAPTMEQIFSLPPSVIEKELTILEDYGLVQKSDTKWTATRRGQQVAAVWCSFGSKGTIEVETTANKWLLGPGEFLVDEMIRDRPEISETARGFGICDTASAVKYLEDRRDSATRFESFIVDWPRTSSDAKYGIFAEAIVLNTVKLAETDESLSLLKDYFTAHVRAVIQHGLTAKVPLLQNKIDRKADTVESLEKNGEDVLKRFEEAQRNQRKINKQLNKAAATCKAWLAGEWLAANVTSIRAAFEIEPAAFVFNSTVPLAKIKSLQPTAKTRPPKPQPKIGPNRNKGILRSVFRWLFG